MLQTSIGNYTLLSELASGSFGRVYLAQHAVLTNRTVALKLMQSTPLNSQGEREQFIHEARVLEVLHHPYILPIIDVGIHEGVPYIVSEYAAQGSLRRRLQQYGNQPFPPEVALTILGQVGQALQYVHQHNIIHRDIKPENILFNTRGEALLADFGLAAMLSSTSIKFTNSAGTPHYMAPEQFQDIISRESDQYALGCIAYELFTGQRVYNASDAVSLMYKHVMTQPTPPSQHNPSITPQIEQAILKALAKQRHERHADVQAFLFALGISLPSNTQPSFQPQTDFSTPPQSNLVAPQQFVQPSSHLLVQQQSFTNNTAYTGQTYQQMPFASQLTTSPATYQPQPLASHETEVTLTNDTQDAQTLLRTPAPANTMQSIAQQAEVMTMPGSAFAQAAPVPVSSSPPQEPPAFPKQAFKFTRPILFSLALIALLLLGSGTLFLLHQPSASTPLQIHGIGGNISLIVATATPHVSPSPTAKANNPTNPTPVATQGQTPPTPTVGVTLTGTPQPAGNPPLTPTPTMPGIPNLVVSAGITTSPSPVLHQNFSASYTVENIGTGPFDLKTLLIAMRGPHNENIDLGGDGNSTPIQPNESRTISLSTPSLAGSCTSCGAGIYTLFVSVWLPNNTFFPQPPTINGAQSQVQVNVSASYSTTVAATQDVPGMAVAPVPFGAIITISAPATPSASYTPTSDGTCIGGPIMTDPNGIRYVGGKACGAKIDPTANDPKAYVGQLLYGISCNGATKPTWYAAGTSTQFTLDAATYCAGNSSQPATLSLLYNDTPGGYTNNSGSYSVSVNVTF